MNQFVYANEGNQSSGSLRYSALDEPPILEQLPFDPIDEASVRAPRHRGSTLLRAGAAAAGLALTGVLAAGCGGHAAGEGKFEPATSSSPKPPTVAGTSTPESSTQGQLQQPEVYVYRGQPVCDMVYQNRFANIFKTDVSDISTCNPDSPWPAADRGVISSGTWVQKSTGMKYEVIVTHDVVNGHSQFDDRTTDMRAVELYNVSIGNAPELTGYWDANHNIGAIRTQTANEGMLDVWYVFDNSAANGGNMAPLTDPELATKIVGYEFSGLLVPEVFDVQNLHE